MPRISRFQREEIFSTAHLQGGLRAKTVKSTRATLLAQAIKLGLQVLSITVMARLLEPSDFGLIAMVTVFTGLALKFMEGGLAMATVQRAEISHAQVSNLFWINAGLGVALFALSSGVSPLVAQIYGEPALVPIMIALSLQFFIGGLSVQHDAILKRQMRFGAISVIDVVSMAAGVIGAIVLAMGGADYWALVYMPLITFTVQTIMRWWFVAWFPSFIRKGTGVKPLIKFGLNLTGANAIGYVTTQITPFVVGLIGGPRYLGFYNRSHSITAIPSTQLLPPIMNVMQSAMTRVADSPQRLRRAALSLIRKIAIVSMVLSVIMFVTADWLVLLALGDGWGEAVPIFRILSLSTIVTPITTFTAIILISYGQARALMNWKMITFGILAVSIGIGSYWGVMGVILAHGLSGFFIRMPLFLAYSTRYQPVTKKDYAQALLPVLVCALITVVSVFLLRGLYEPITPFVGVTLYASIAGIIYLGLCLIVPSLRTELEDTLRLFRSLYRKRHADKA